MYIPVFLQWILLSLRYRSLSLPLIANPAVPLSGMVGMAKSDVFDAAGDYARQWILPWSVFVVSDAELAQQCRAARQLLAESGLCFPVVAKPEIGCRGVGVKLLQDEAELEAYIGGFPAGGSIQFQKLSRWTAEAGVFYVRHPDEPCGRVTSLALKYIPYVVGDGRKTLAELVAEDPRAGELSHLYQQRHADNWDVVIPEEEPYRLVFAASHSRGAVFRDGQELISDKLVQSLDKIFDDIPGFNYGRLDVKFKDVSDLMEGMNYAIIEINGASSESINIWDRNAGFWLAIKTLLQQYSTLFKLGHANRKRGHTPPGLRVLYKAWRIEHNLVKRYPPND